MAEKRKSGLTTLDLYVLDRACEPVWQAFDGGTYLVGTAHDGGPYRDVDVRTILPDASFDRLFAGDEGKDFWALLCSSIGMRLREATGLPIDYQIQRSTEANENYPGPGKRNPLGMGVRDYAGGGDATRFDAQARPSEVAGGDVFLSSKDFLASLDDPNPIEAGGDPS